MMERTDYVLYTDSSADLTADLVAETKAKVVPLSYTVGDVTRLNSLDDPSYTYKQFYDELRDGKMAITSAANAGDFEDAFRGDLEQGKDILYIGFSSGLSATVRSAQTAADALLEEFPERKILIVDSLCASLGQGLLVYLCAKKAAEGCNIEEVRDYAEKLKPNLSHWFTVDDLGFLKRGGRISAATAVVGSMLSIKPVLHVDDAGKLISVSKARGRNSSLKALTEKMKETALSLKGQTVFISHGDCLEDAEKVAAAAKELGAAEVHIGYVGPVIGAHAGPGVLALFFLGRER